MPEKGFFGALFDIGFRNFVTTKIVSVLFVIALVVSGLTTLLWVISAFAADSGLGLLVLVLSPLLFLLFALYSRVLLEFVVVVFRIYENTRIMAEAGQGSTPTAPSAPTTTPLAQFTSPPPMPPPAGPESPGPQSPRG